MIFALVLRVTQAPIDESGFDTFRIILGQWILPTIMAMIVLFGLSRQVRVYESFVKGAKEGFEIAIMIIPFLVAILVAIGRTGSDHQRARHSPGSRRLSRRCLTDGLDSTAFG